MKILISEAYSGRTLLSFFKGELKISGRLLTRLKQTENGILVNGEHATVRKIIFAGDELEIFDGDLTSSEKIEPRELPVTVLYEDNDAVVLAKPPKMPTHPSHGHTDDTLANALAFRFLGEPFVFRPINRLDRDTSGVVLVAKNQRAAAYFADAMKNGGFEKTYLAITDGELCTDGVIEKPIRRAKESIILREVCEPLAPGAQYARTEYEVLDTKNGHSLLLIRPRTGRTHQIRVHLSSLGASICGDSLYGGSTEHIERQALHALSLEFSLPSGERLKVSAPMPDDMSALCCEFKLGREVPDEFFEKK